MSAQPLAIAGSGMVTGVGLNTPATCVAIRCAIDNFQETRFMDSGGEWIMGCEVSLEQPWRGATKLAKMLAMVLRECVATDPELKLESIPIFLCLSEEERPGRFQNLSNQLYEKVQKELSIRFHKESKVIALGHVGTAIALSQARRLVYEERFPTVIIAGVDSLLVGHTLKIYEEQEHILTSQNSNGFIPGEAAVSILVQHPQISREKQMIILQGLGFGTENATQNSEKPLRADGLVEAVKSALADAGCAMSDVDYRITDISGSQYQFKEASLAVLRTLRERKEEFNIWHPADCIGEVGSAIGGIMLCVVLVAHRKLYKQGDKVLCHMGNYDGKRAALILSSHSANGEN